MKKTFYYAYAGSDAYAQTHLNQLYCSSGEWWKVAEDILGNEITTSLLEGVYITVKSVKKLPKVVREASKQVPYEIAYTICINNKGAYTYIFLPKN